SMYTTLPAPRRRKESCPSQEIVIGIPAPPLPSYPLHSRTRVQTWDHRAADCRHEGAGAVVPALVEAAAAAVDRALTNVDERGYSGPISPLAVPRSQFQSKEVKCSWSYGHVVFWSRGLELRIAHTG